MSNVIEHNILTARQELANKRISDATRYIWVTFSKIGFHQYPDAANNPNLEDVSYLGSTHRHKFGFKVRIEIFHNDRELEFHQFLNFCQAQFDSNTIHINHKSVEMLADDLYVQIAVHYPNRNVIIDIDEDGENGCSIEYRNNKEQ